MLDKKFETSLNSPLNNKDHKRSYSNLV